MARGWLLLLSAFLLVWIPFNFAVELTSSLPTAGLRGAPAMVELLVHAVAAALAVAAGRALWNGSQDARLAAVAVVVNTAVGIQSLLWTYLPTQTRPGTGGPLALLYAAAGAVALIYLRRRGRPSR